MNVRVEQFEPTPYRAVAREVTLPALEDFLAEAIARLAAGGPASGPPFAIYYGRVNEQSRARVEVTADPPSSTRSPSGAGSRV